MKVSSKKGRLRGLSGMLLPTTNFDNRMKIGKLVSLFAGAPIWRSPRGRRLSPILTKMTTSGIPSHGSGRDVDQKSLAEKNQPTEGQDMHQTIRVLPSRHLEKGT